MPDHFWLAECLQPEGQCVLYGINHPDIRKTIAAIALIQLISPEKAAMDPCSHLLAVPERWSSGAGLVSCLQRCCLLQPVYCPHEAGVFV
jgi:hypothetical protein